MTKHKIPTPPLQLINKSGINQVTVFNRPCVAWKPAVCQRYAKKPTCFINAAMIDVLYLLLGNHNLFPVEPPKSSVK